MRAGITGEDDAAAGMNSADPIAQGATMTTAKGSGSIFLS
jgi:hypothetical protein